MRINYNLRNVLSLFSVDFISKLISFAALTYLARILGTEGFGLISIAMAVLSYSMILGSLGFNYTGTKNIAGKIENPDTFTSNILAAKLLISLFIFILVTLLSFIFIKSEEILQLIIIYNLFLFPSALLLEWFFQGYQKMHIISIGRIVGLLGYLFFLLIFVNSSDDTIMTAWGWIAGGIINTVFLFYIFIKNRYTLKFIPGEFHFLSLVKESLSLGIASLISQFVISFPVIYIGLTLTANEAGIFNAALRVVAFLLVADRVFVVIFFPKIVKYFKEAPDMLHEVFNRVLKIITAFSLSISLLIIVSAELLTTLIFGNSFSGAAFLLQILTGFFVFSLISSIFTYTLISMNRENDYTASMFWAILIFLGIIFLFDGIEIPAVSLVAFQLGTLLLMAIRIRNELRIKIIKTMIIPMVITLIFLFLLTYLEFELFIQIIISFIIGVPALFAASGLTIEDFRFLKRIFI